MVSAKWLTRNGLTANSLVKRWVSSRSASSARSGSAWPRRAMNSPSGQPIQPARPASLVSKVQTPDPRAWASVEEVYEAATTGSARALGFKDIGAIAPGMKADIVFLDLGSINWIPHHWSVNQMVHAEDGTGVRHVMIGGRFVVQDRRLLTMDLAKLAAEAEAASERLEALNAEWKGLFERLEPVVASFCPALAAQPYHLRRYLCDAPE